MDPSLVLKNQSVAGSVITKEVHVYCFEFYITLLNISRLSAVDRRLRTSKKITILGYDSESR